MPFLIISVIKSCLSPFLDFYNYDGTKYTGQNTPENQDETCTGTSVTWVFENGGRRQACSQKLLFEDHFDTINTTTWNSINRFAGAPVRVSSLFIIHYLSENNRFYNTIVIQSIIFIIFIFYQDYEFVIYMTNDVTDVSNGWLRITPIPLETKFSNEEFILNGELEVQE